MNNQIKSLPTVPVNESSPAGSIDIPDRQPKGGVFTMKDTFYFPHDYNARTDDNIKLLIRKYGMLGYGIYWAIVEDLYNNANELRLDCEGIAYDLRVDQKDVESIINDFGLFVIDGGFFGSLSVERRLSERNAKSAKCRESAFKRWNNPKPNANAKRTQSDPNAIKERKGNKKKGKRDVFKPPTQKEVIDYFKEHDYPKELAVRAWEYYNEGNWVDSNGKRVINWKQKMLSVWLKVENKINTHEKSHREKADPTEGVRQGGYGYEDEIKIDGPTV